VREPSPRNEGQHKVRVLVNRHKVLMAPKASPYAGAKAGHKKIGLYVKSRRFAFWPILKSWLSVSHWVDCGRLPRFMKPSAA